MNDQAAHTLNMHLQIIRDQQRKQSGALERIADTLEAIAKSKT